MTMFGGILYVLKTLKVDNILIGKQFVESSNYIEFLKLTKNKNVKVLVAGNKLSLTNSVKIDVLWPDENSKVTENSINNNALVFKLKTREKTVLFTGDIEEETEKVLIKKYKNTNILKSDILKVAHHGSNSSSTEEFLNLVKPQIALIGVGKDNKYGHPDESTIEKLKKMNCKIYRTDQMGEIILYKDKIDIINKSLKSKF